MATHESVQNYLDTVDPNTLPLLNQIRALITGLDANIIEYPSYGILGYKLNKSKFYLGGYKTHIGLYATQSIPFFENELKPYKTFKGTIQIPVNKTLPLALIEKIARHALKI